MNSSIPAAAQEPMARMPEASVRLTTLCAEAEEDRRVRRMAWTVSICVVFLAIGLLGLWHPPRPAPRVVPSVQFTPVTLVEPASAPEPQPTTSALNPGSEEAPTKPPQILVAAADSPEVAFSVPVPASAVLVPVSQATLPAPANPSPASSNTAFLPGSGGTDTPQPTYPRLAEQRGYQGKVVVNFTVQPSGAVSQVTLGRSSGFTVLDEAALSTIRNRWRFAPGELRHHYVEIIFQLK